MKDKYEYFNFNDNLNGMMTLFVLLLNNNWIFISELIYFVKGNFVSYFFLISFGVLIRFVATNLILGLIAKVIILYFQDEFEMEKETYLDHFDDYSFTNSEEEEEMNDEDEVKAST